MREVWLWPGKPQQIPPHLRRPSSDIGLCAEGCRIKGDITRAAVPRGGPFWSDIGRLLGDIVSNIA